MGIRTLILGAGNILLRDEGVGVHAVRALRERYRFPEGVEIMDGGTMGLDLLASIEGAGRLLIVDAVKLDEPPGTIRTIAGKDVKTFLDTKLSVHQIGLSDVLSAAFLKGVSPPVICVIGIEPESIEVGLELSDALLGRFDSLLHAVLELLGRWGIETRPASSAGHSKFFYKV